MQTKITSGFIVKARHICYYFSEVIIYLSYMHNNMVYAFLPINLKLMDYDKRLGFFVLKASFIIDFRRKAMKKCLLQAKYLENETNKHSAY